MLELFILCGMAGVSEIGLLVAGLMYLKAEQDTDALKAKEEKQLVCLQKRKVEA